MNYIILTRTSTKMDDLHVLYIVGANGQFFFSRFFLLLIMKSNMLNIIFYLLIHFVIKLHYVNMWHQGKCDENETKD